MNTKLLIGGVVIVIVVLVVYLLSQPKEVVAPVEAPASATEATSQLEDTGNTLTGTVSNEDDSEDLPMSVTVTYDGSTFTPESISIVKGGTVRFVNTSDAPMWVGADNHPSHALYPVKSDSDCLGSSFDQCTATGKGSSWTYTFTEVGTWGYHNHRRSAHSGEVIVTAE
jgi:plastocyanin